MKKRLIALLSAFTIALVPASSFGATQIQGSSESLPHAGHAVQLIDDIVLGVGEQENEDAYDFKDGDGPDVRVLPTAYNLTNKDFIKDENGDTVLGQNVISSIKFQNPFGTCWSFGAIAAAEGSIVSEARANGEDADPNAPQYDLSEKHLAYFAYKEIDDKNSSQYGEGIKFYTDNPTSSDIYNSGGFSFYASKAFASGTGPALESKYPYRGKKGLIFYIREADGRQNKYCYSEKDDWSLNSEDRNNSAYMLRESACLPNPNGTDENGNYEFNEDGLIAIRQKIVEGNPVAISFCADNSMPGQENKSDYISNNWAHYTYKKEWSNHCVAVVGYDDNYSRENFKPDHMPDNDGAFLVKNSWGAADSEFPHKGGGDWGIRDENGNGSGYFWLSYYDQSIQNVEAFNLDKGSASEYEIAQYDYTPSETVACLDEDFVCKTANVFKAKDNSFIRKVGYETCTPGTEARVQIVILDDNYETPEDGVVVWEDVIKHEYGGYHTLNIDDEIIVQSGQSYAVIVEAISEDGKHEMQLDMIPSEEATREAGFTSYSNCIVNKGESYLFSDKDGSVWSDWTEVKKSLESEYDYIEVDNCGIKAFTQPSDEIDDFTGEIKIKNAEIYASGTNKINLKEGKEIASFNIIGKSLDGTVLQGEDVEWASTDESVLKLTAAEGYSDKSLAFIKPVGLGEAYVYFRIKGYGVAMKKLKVVANIDSLQVCPNQDLNYTGKNKTPDVKVIDEFGDLVPKDAYSIKYSNNVNAGEANVVVEAKDDSLYNGKAEATFTIAKAKQTPSIKTSSLKVKYSKAKKNAVKTAAVEVKGARGTKVFKKTGGSSKLTINSKTGKITVKKGTKKGTYSIKIKVTASGDKNYKSGSTTKTVKVKVK